MFSGPDMKFSAKNRIFYTATLSQYGAAWALRGALKACPANNTRPIFPEEGSLKQTLSKLDTHRNILITFLIREILYDYNL